MTKWKDKTRDGSAYRIYDENAGQEWPIHGAVKTSSGTYIAFMWKADGSSEESGYGGYGLDLVPADPEPVEQVRSLDEYCQTYCNECYSPAGTIKRGIKAVLDLAGVKYREG